MRGGRPPANTALLDQLRLLGAPPDVLQATEAWAEREAAAADVPVWPQHWHAVSVFLRLGTQWRKLYGPGGSAYEGLRYESVPPIMQAVASELPKPLRQPRAVLWRQLQYLEQAVLDAQAEAMP